jgi:hypothetical protein
MILAGRLTTQLVFIVGGGDGDQMMIVCCDLLLFTYQLRRGLAFLFTVAPVLDSAFPLRSLSSVLTFVRRIPISLSS